MRLPSTSLARDARAFANLGVDDNRGKSTRDVEPRPACVSSVTTEAQLSTYVKAETEMTSSPSSQGVIAETVRDVDASIDIQAARHRHCKARGQASRTWRMPNEQQQSHHGPRRNP
jgi:hypothetical protein